MQAENVKWRTRLYVRTLTPAHCEAGAELDLDRDQSHFIRNVLRGQAGERLRIFNEEQGEYGATVVAVGKKTVRLRCDEKLREAEASSGLTLAFAPIKRLDYLVQKAVEMGVSVLQPVITERTQGNRFSLERMQANIIEAVEQCERVSLPEGCAPLSLSDFLAGTTEKPLFFCDETRTKERPQIAPFDREASILVGPEGGFTPAEQEVINAQPNVRPLSLGPHILRADTAIVAALALVQFAAPPFSNKPSQ